MSNLGAGLKSQTWDPATMPKFEKSFCTLILIAPIPRMTVMLMQPTLDRQGGSCRCRAHSPGG